ncbi:MAG TPA: hypothetical protein P5295_16105 [Spirochaetota bacterium]|nr:hypothetical protein [Spirochaetota bacterium]
MGHEGWTIIQKGSVLPDDFLVDWYPGLNYEKYIIQIVCGDEGLDEYMGNLDPDKIGGIVIGMPYKPVRFRERTKDDPPFDVKNRFEVRIAVQRAIDQDNFLERLKPDGFKDSRKPARGPLSKAIMPIEEAVKVVHKEATLHAFQRAMDFYDQMRDPSVVGYKDGVVDGLNKAYQYIANDGNYDLTA